MAIVFGIIISNVRIVAIQHQKKESSAVNLTLKMNWHNESVNMSLTSQRDGKHKWMQEVCRALVPLSFF
jgi:hypothetical protein